jgi:hypothetical protein
VSSFVHGLIGPHVARAARPRRRVRWSRLAAATTGAVASAAGHVLRVTVAAARLLPGLGAGAAFVVGGFVLASWVGWVVLGVVLLALDRRTAA